MKINKRILRCDTEDVGASQRFCKGTKMTRKKTAKITSLYTAIGNSGHPLNQDYDTIQSHRKEYPMAKRRRFTAEFKATVLLEALRGESSQAEVCRHHNLSEDPLSKWKH